MGTPNPSAANTPSPAISRRAFVAAAASVPLLAALPAIAAKAPAAGTYGKDVVYSGPMYESMKVEGDTVVVSAKDMVKPVAVRYAWADNPEYNLYNKADLPASPFRTDDWPVGEQQAAKK
jgi:sialate O-acetylesterase